MLTNEHLRSFDRLEEWMNQSIEEKDDPIVEYRIAGEKWIGKNYSMNYTICGAQSEIPGVPFIMQLFPASGGYRQLPITTNYSVLYFQLFLFIIIRRVSRKSKTSFIWFRYSSGKQPKAISSS